MRTDPTEAEIKAILDLYTPRQIAIAYIRAVKREKENKRAINRSKRKIAEAVRSEAFSGIWDGLRAYQP
ncbi:MAG: hypothetical protein U5N55_12765 [Cypionkella sp.]|nr:hypothetical protein [Cypionkella sp.]